jgi:hypothetical protein
VWESGCIATPFFTTALYVGEWSASRPGRFTPGKIALSTHWVGSWVGLRAGLDTGEEKSLLSLPEIEPWPWAHMYVFLYLRVGRDALFNPTHRPILP